MLSKAGPCHYSFVHRTFLEYFAARAFHRRLENDGESELVNLFRTRWKDNAWREVLGLICGMVRTDLAQRLVRELLAAKGEENGWRAVFLAAECSLEVRELIKMEGRQAQWGEAGRSNMSPPLSFWSFLKPPTDLAKLALGLACEGGPTRIRTPLFYEVAEISACQRAGSSSTAKPLTGRVRSSEP
jgi:hypothetical protein